jgi:ribose/xylose/arabinose/galactoside ABC-type transport system permease subunit
MADNKTGQRAAGKPKSFVGRITAIGEIGLLVVFAVLFLIFSVASPYFLTVRNLSNILGQISMTLVAAVGLSMLLISGEVDISIGSLQALVALPLLVIMNATGSFWLGAIVALAAGAAVGVTNGLIVTRLKVNSLITTLGMYYLLRGFVYLVTGKVPISDQSGKDLFFIIGNGKLFRFLPYTAILMFVVLLLFMWVLRSTTFGRRLYAVGGNPSVARAMGISPERMKLISFILCSFLASVSAILLASRLGSAVHTAGIGFEFQVVAAVVLGGVSLAGGIGNLLGAFLGVLILGIIQNGLGMLEVNTQWQQVVTGGIIILAVFLDELKKRHG